MRNIFAGFTFGILGLVVTLAACSGSSNDSNTGSSGNPSGSSGTPGCTCNVSDNGVSQAIACSNSSCVNGTTYACSADAQITMGGACTASKTDGGQSGGDGSAPSSGPLTCLSYTWCGSGKVTQWNGQTLSTGRGGAIPDGLYREAYIIAEKDTGTTFGDYGSAYLFRKGYVRELGFGRVGTFTTSQSKLSIAYTSNCDDQSGKATSSSTSSENLDYFVDSQGQLFLFFQSTGSSGSQTVAHVYKPEATLCGNLPSSVPATPGDSFVCTVTNCGCTEASDGPANADTCTFVHGG